MILEFEDGNSLKLNKKKEIAVSKIDKLNKTIESVNITRGFEIEQIAKEFDVPYDLVRIMKNSGKIKKCNGSDV
jgi:pyridoxal biosynthesis lyase PdxS